MNNQQRSFSYPSFITSDQFLLQKLVSEHLGEMEHHLICLKALEKSTNDNIDITEKDAPYNSVLHYAARYYDNANIIEKIIQSANFSSGLFNWNRNDLKKNLIGAKNHFGKSALDIAVEYQHFNVAKKLVELYLKYFIPFDEKKAGNEYVQNELHEYLKKSIQEKNCELVKYFLESNCWENIFGRYNDDFQSPMQLLIIHMPDQAKELLQKCVKKDDKDFMSQLILDYPADSMNIPELLSYLRKSMIDKMHSCYSIIQKKYQKIFLLTCESEATDLITSSKTTELIEDENAADKKYLDDIIFEASSEHEKIHCGHSLISFLQSKGGRILENSNYCHVGCDFDGGSFVMCNTKDSYLSNFNMGTEESIDAKIELFYEEIRIKSDAAVLGNVCICVSNKINVEICEALMEKGIRNGAQKVLVIHEHSGRVLKSIRPHPNNISNYDDSFIYEQDNQPSEKHDTGNHNNSDSSGKERQILEAAAFNDWQIKSRKCLAIARMSF